jgi:hypothetical protein
MVRPGDHVITNIRLTDAQRARYVAIGRGDWLRRVLDGITEITWPPIPHQYRLPNEPVPSNSTTVLLTQAQRAKFDALGGIPWIHKFLDEMEI